MTEQAMPCPFCGKVPNVDNPATFRHETGDRWAAVVCCIVGPEIRAGFYTPLEEWKDEAIAAWNERVPAAVPIAIYNALMASLAIMRDECGTTPGEVSAREWLRARGKIVAAAKAREVDGG